jgi:hypothetical protein
MKDRERAVAVETGRAGRHELGVGFLSTPTMDGDARALLGVLGE